MWVLFILLISSTFANDVDLVPIRDVEKQLPTMEEINANSEIDRSLNRLKYRPPNRYVPMKEISASGIDTGAIGPGKTLFDLKGTSHLVTTEHFYSKFYRLQDEQGFTYLISEDGTCNYKIRSEHIESIRRVTDLYVPPHRYTPAPLNITRSEYDAKLKISPEAAFYFGYVNGAYMRDLFNDSKALHGMTTQYGIHAFTNWDLPIKTGLVLHYEKTTYELSGNGKVNYSSVSVGPQFKTRETSIFDALWRAQLQFRISPLSRVDAQTSNGDLTLKFNSADMLLSFEHPVKNSWGEFVLGIFFQSQWLNIKDQPEIVSINATNETNNSFGLFFAQVFQ